MASVHRREEKGRRHPEAQGLQRWGCRWGVMNLPTRTAGCHWKQRKLQGVDFLSGLPEGTRATNAFSLDA